MPAHLRNFVLLLAVLLVTAWWLRSREGAAPTVPAVAPVPPPSVESRAETSADTGELDRLYDQILSTAPEGEKPLPFKTKARVHLKPGESAVIGFWQISKDSNGLAMITPEVLPDGNVVLAAKILKLSDAAANDKVIRDLFPAPFAMEQSGAMKSEAVHRVTSHLYQKAGVSISTMPIVTTRSGSLATIQIFNGGPGLQNGFQMDLAPGTPAADGSFDLDIGLDVK